MILNRTALSFLPFVMIAASPSGAQPGADIALSAAGLADSRLFSGARSEDVLAVQVLLDHSGHSPGTIDGVMGGNTTRAIAAFQRANGMQADGKMSGGLLARLRAAFSGDLLQRYTIKAEDIAGPFVSVPEGMEAQAELDTLGFESPAEALAEKFHMAQAFLVALNPGVDFGAAGSEITVVVPGKGELGAKVDRIEVDKAGSELRAYASDGALVATYPATIGSSAFPSPDGSMEVTAVAAAPTYHFDPEGRDWGPDKQLTIAAGPNNPVGGTWIDLSKEGYGIHGTPEPRLIGKTSSHGCVRLTNWDAVELAKAVSKGTAVAFV
jgi:lipoprotein-anchoring transpeptidase ErfK/SrfK